MSKFKEGDRVMCIRKVDNAVHTFSSHANVGEVYTVKRSFIGNISKVAKFESLERSLYFPEENFELEVVANSPLYKALS